MNCPDLPVKGLLYQVLLSQIAKVYTMSGYLLFTLVPEVNTDLTVCLPVGVHDPPQLLPVLSRAGYRVTLHLLFLYAGCAKPCCHQGTELTADAREGAHGHNIRLHC